MHGRIVGNCMDSVRPATQRQLPLHRMREPSPSNQDLKGFPVNPLRSFVKPLVRIFLTTITFMVFFYATTIAMSIIYPLDAAMLTF